MQKKWLIKNSPDKNEIKNLSKELKIDRVIAHLLLQRGIDSYQKAESFFRPKLEDLHDPFLLKNMKHAVQRLNEAIQNNEKILLFGDYDVDGTTAVALMYSFLKEKVNLDFYIPNREKEGYGISNEGIDYAEKINASLIIALDCGIKSIDKVEYAKEKHIDFMICDHHTPGEKIPDAIVLNPKQKDCSYPYKELSGCGVGFKLLQAFSIDNNIDIQELYQYLDLLAISIGADIVPVTGENRILCYHGMLLLNNKPRTSFKTLLQLSNKNFPVTLTDVVFSIAPKINAAGRIESAKHSVELMISKNENRIKDLALKINEYNETRKELQKNIVLEALKQIESDKQHSGKYTNVVYASHWHKGVVGIVASKIIEKHYKPTIVFTLSEGKIVGSARSIEGFDIYQALEQCEDLLEQFGGHKAAAGMTILPENYNAFKEKFESVVSQTLKKELLTPEQIIDISIDFDEIFKNGENRTKIPRLKRILSQFEPHGPGNMKPVFMTPNVFSIESKLLKDEHIKLKVCQPNNDVVMDGIGFFMPDKFPITTNGAAFDIAYTLEKNNFKDKETLQMNIKDIRNI